MVEICDRLKDAKQADKNKWIERFEGLTFLLTRWEMSVPLENEAVSEDWTGF